MTPLFPCGGSDPRCVTARHKMEEMTLLYISKQFTEAIWIRKQWFWIEFCV